MIQTSVSKITSTIFACGRFFEHDTLFERGEHQVGEELGGGFSRNDGDLLCEFWNLNASGL